MAELRDMAAAYVLGALSADEYAAFESALQGSSELAKEVAEFRSVVAHIGTEQRLEPPPALRARFLAKIASDKMHGASSEGAQRAFSVSDGGSPKGPAVYSLQKRTPSQPWWVSGALALALAASLIFAVNSNQRVKSLSTELLARDSVLKVRELTLSQRDTSLNTVLEAERQLIVVNLVSAPDNGPGVQFFWNVKQGRGLLHAFRLKPAAAGRSYQVWLIKDGKPVPSRVFNADADDHGLVWSIEMPKDTKGVTAIAITDEPAGGSKQPTTTPFLVGELPKATQ